jgi:hypothetical protein
MAAAKKTTKKKKSVKAVRKTGKQRAPKGLEQLVRACLNNKEFIQQLEKDPRGALREYGYPDDPELVKEIKRIDFAVFRKYLRSGGIFNC